MLGPVVSSSENTQNVHKETKSQSTKKVKYTAEAIRLPRIDLHDTPKWRREREKLGWDKYLKTMRSDFSETRNESQGLCNTGVSGCSGGG